MALVKIALFRVSFTTRLKYPPNNARQIGSDGSSPVILLRLIFIFSSFPPDCLFKSVRGPKSHQLLVYADSHGDKNDSPNTAVKVCVHTSLWLSIHDNTAFTCTHETRPTLYWLNIDYFTKFTKLKCQSGLETYYDFKIL